ncbi:IS982 family transposase [Leptospira noguchii]|uniref:IS982 family transposase n=1 Tax=Leptospira noguchii TaxID=28182 RepID=UPI001FB7DF02|nr:IS982 family transposase [Leptospira noguchii]UOG30161.1 IS982 family transposase [Leptospira noguchii]UOG31836.1 IS982 family transposase [Leptospira noguchii]
MDLTEIFCAIDDYCTQQKINWNVKILSPVVRKRNRKFQLSLSEVATIVVYFHLSHYREFKNYYLIEIKKNLKSEFPKAVSYNRFVELMPNALCVIASFLSNTRMGKCSGISFIDSTILKVCDNRRIHSHKVFKNIAQRGKSSTGWFYGFKLHLIINDRGEILSFMVTPGNVDDRNSKVIFPLVKNIYDKLFGDRGYISQSLFESLYEKGIQLITKLKKNMKNKLMPLVDKILLRKRAIIESVNDELKNICQIQHTRHRSFFNWAVNLLSGLVAYSFFPKKPSLNLRSKDNLQLLISP